MRGYVLLLAGVALLQPALTRAQAAASPQTPTQSAAKAPVPSPDRKSIKVPEKVLETYVGEYELTPERILTITLEDGSLWGQPTGQSKRQLFAESQTKFFLKDSPVEVTFRKEKEKVVGLVMTRSDGSQRELKKIK